MHHHDDVAGLAAFAAAHGLVVVAVDNTPGAVRLETAPLPRECVLLFGQEGPGLTDAARAAAGLTVSIAQFGSTRSVNAGVAAGIAMHAWVRAHADLSSRVVTPAGRRAGMPGSSRLDGLATLSVSRGS